jgi:hypothetical protein
LQRCASLKGLPSRRKQRDNDRDHVAEKLQRRLPKFNQFSQNVVFGRDRPSLVATLPVRACKPSECWDGAQPGPDSSLISTGRTISRLNRQHSTSPLGVRVAARRFWPNIDAKIRRLLFALLQTLIGLLNPNTLKILPGGRNSL